MRLSDGSNFTPSAPLGSQQAADQVNAAEANLDHFYRSQAAKNDAPVTPPAWTDEHGQSQQPSKTYSAQGVYSNNTLGRTSAYLDHTAAGKAAGSALDYVNSLVPREAEEGVGRAATNALMAPHDVPAMLYNTTKHYIAPTYGTSYDINYAAPALRQAAGIEELSPNASWQQRYGEAALTGALGGGAMGGGSLLEGAAAVPRGAVLGGTSQLGSDVGGKFGGEAGSAIGGLLGGGYAESALRSPGKLAPTPIRPTAEPTLTDILAGQGTGPQAAAAKPESSGGGLNPAALGFLGFLQKGLGGAVGGLAAKKIGELASSGYTKAISSDLYNRLYNMPPNLLGDPLSSQLTQTATLPAQQQTPGVVASSPATGWNPQQDQNAQPSPFGWTPGQR